MGLHHIHIFYLLSECDHFWSQGLISEPSGYSPDAASPLILQKWENSSVLHQLSPLWRSDWTLSDCWQRFYSETAPPCRLCGGSPVCCVGALPPAHNTARGILHTIALLFGCHLRTICMWPHSNSVWARRLWRFYLHGLQIGQIVFLCIYVYCFFQIWSPAYLISFL